jgi:hypothetical protein
LLAGVAACAAQSSVALHYVVIDNFPVKCVTVNLSDPEVTVTTAVARSFPHGLESWGSYLNRLHPDVAINGTYFCTHDYQPVGDVAVNGALLYRGAVGTALCISPDNRAVMMPGPRQAISNWTGARTVICAGPRLLTDGQVTLHAREEGFRDGRVLGSAPRSAIGLRADGTLLLLTIERDISLMNLAVVCRKLGAVQAMALDGGSSSALYAEGRTVTHPGRSVSNIIAVYSSRQRAAAVADQFAPSPLPVLARLLPETPATTTASQDTVFMASAWSPSSEPTSASAPVVRILKPNTTQPLKGTIPVSISITPNGQFAWCSLFINGKLKAMSNATTLEYDWDSTKEANGEALLDVSAWSGDRVLLASVKRKVTLQNTTEIAAR